MNYTTQMNAARKNIITNEMKEVAVYEQISVEEVKELVAKGQIAIRLISITLVSSHMG